MVKTRSGRYGTSELIYLQNNQGCELTKALRASKKQRKLSSSAILRRTLHGGRKRS
ncbi:MAG: hypothetical protein QNJ51_14285 [Calothrix sp. MO_167.B12]|nr:hypothetical protein [Calothrix sp. MO_167.B12]